MRIRKDPLNPKSAGARPITTALVPVANKNRLPVKIEINMIATKCFF